MSLDHSSGFFARNKTAIALTALAGVSAAGAYYYYTQVQGDSDSTSEGSSKLKKKKKKSKSTKGGDSEESSSNGGAKKSSNGPVTKLYPVDSKGLPALTSEIIEGLSESDKKDWAAALKEDGNGFFKEKKYTEAIAFYTGALELKIDPVFYSNRSACYSALSDHENVIKDTTEAIKLKPDYTKCLLRRSTSYEILENYPEAMFDLTKLTVYGGFSNKSVEQVLERVLKKHSMKIVEENMKNVTLELPSASTMSSFFSAFVSEYTPEGINEESEGADKFLFDALAQVYTDTVEGYEEGNKLFNKAVEAYNVEELTKESPEASKAAIALEYRATFNFLKNDSASATVDIERAITLKARARTYVLRALLNADKSSYADAMGDFETAQKIDAESPDIYYHLGQLYYLTGELEKAKTNFLKAKELNPQNVYAYVQLACITYRSGKFEDAEEEFATAKLKFATSPVIPNYFGEILTDHGDIKGAYKQFDTAARLQQVLPTYTVGALPLINKASLLVKESPDKLNEAGALLEQACDLDAKSELAKISLAQIKLQNEDVDAAIPLFEQASKLARTFEEKVQATSFAEATKMQKRIKADPEISKKMEELMRQNGLA